MRIVAEIFALLLLVLALAGCTKPVGQMGYDEFIWREATIDANYQEVFRRIKEGFHKCSEEDASDGNLYTDIQEARLAIYHAGRPDVGLGKIVIKALDDQHTHVTIGAAKFWGSGVGKSGLIGATWFDWAKGNTGCGEYE